MLIRITEKCDMGCFHCMVDATPEGQHMTLKTYDNVLSYLVQLKMPFIMLTGGEPTQNPYIIEMINKAKLADLKPLLLSNGTFLENNELKEKIIKTGIDVQITNDPRYYPRKIPIVENSNFSYEHQLRVISPFHRALKNNIPITSKAPGCFNLRSMCRNSDSNSLPMAMMGLGIIGKMCTPSVNIDGSISAGESNDCNIVGHVTDDLSIIFNRLCSMRCDKCGLVYKLTNLQKNAIGEMW